MRYFLAATVATSCFFPAQASACQQLPSVYFPSGSTEIDAGARATLEGFAEQALRMGDRIEGIRIIGHSDRTGSAEARRRVSMQRAIVVRETLLAFGIPSRLLRVEGLSDARPLVETADNVREPTNRRVEVQVNLRQSAGSEGNPQPLC